jgi:hypothetical protein
VQKHVERTVMLTKVHYSLLKSLLLTIALCGVGTISLAQQKFVRAKATDANKETALNKATVAAWKNYLGTLQGAKLDNIVANEKSFLSDLSGVVVDVTVVDEKCTSGFSSTCTISIAATINESMVDNRLRQLSQASSGGRAPNRDLVAFLVMARIADSQTSFDTKVTKRAESTVGTSGSSASADASAGNRAGSAEASADAVSVTQTSKTVTGGSQINRRDEFKYIAYPSIDDLQNGVGETLQNNRIRSVPWEALVTRCGVSENDPFSKYFAESTTGQLPPAIRRELFKKLTDCKIPTKFITASITVDGSRKDPNTGLWIMTGNMNIAAFDISDIEFSIGSVSRVFTGRAENKEDAARLALATAAKEAADVMVNQLNKN